MRMIEWERMNSHIYKNNNKWLDKANRHDGVVWKSEIRLIAVFFLNLPVGKVIMLNCSLLPFRINRSIMHV